MNSVLVTGAAGFIGSNLCKKLLENHIVVGVDNFFRGKKCNLPAHQNFQFIEMDLTAKKSSSDLHKIIKKNNITKIFHYAAINGTKYFYDIPLKVFEDNNKMVENVMQSCLGTKVEKVIFSSSSEIYGFNPKTPTTEQDDIVLNIFADRDSYASSKVHNEFYIKLFCQSYGIDYLILRLFNVYGPNMDSTEYGQVIPEFFRKVKEESFEMIGDGSQTRSFCFIDDNIALTLSLDNSKETGVFNVGNDEEILIEDLAKNIHAIYNKKYAPIYLPNRPNDTLVRKPCLKKIRKITGDYKFTPLSEGLRNIAKKLTMLE
jgi:nucleoside-diphosphate-sugar epimerase